MVAYIHAGIHMTHVIVLISS